MKKISFFCGLLLLISSALFAQIGINPDGSAPDASAALDISYTTKGFLLPRMTHEELDAIYNPAEGLMVYCTDCGSSGSGALAMFIAEKWYTLSTNCLNPLSPEEGNHEPSITQIVWKWKSVSWATGYKWNMDNDYGTAEDLGIDTTKTESSLNCNTSYTRYIWAYNMCGESSVTVITQTTSPDPPAAPTEAGHIPSLTQIIWKWNSVPAAEGYKWNTVNDFGSAYDMGADTIKAETGLTYGTSYTRYAWAYNVCGNSIPVALTQLTLSFVCTDSITINHVEGNVAPVNKTVTYGTVTNIPGETSKCWITSNLGADHQASAVDDATEASAGWYWQFNRMQGYKHDGTNRTPNAAWISSIDENTDWLALNDPCTLETGNGWRLPTISEWTNVDAAGSWTNWNIPWNSSLKLHAAGYLNPNEGSLSVRGSFGFYWSSSQGTSPYGSDFRMYSGNCSISSESKAFGFTIRCLRDGSITPTVTTDSVTNITHATATGGGNVTSEGDAPVTAKGVCWSTSTMPTTADDHTTDGSGIGAFESNLTGLSQNTLYYVRAYATSSVGTSYGDEVSFSTLPWACGDSITINHVAGSVAPVTKTVPYGTVTNIPGETSKCWITSNLGADHQATGPYDGTEASAGWYWQFNRMQGYKHDGTTRTPNSTWITSIDENSNWLAANDPCNLELGNGWRLPTYTEWLNVDASGGWYWWPNPWNSALKIHASGGLSSVDGALHARGIASFFWSCTQYNTTNGRYLDITFDHCEMTNVIKVNGFTIRCIRE